jgi:signal transduction histidine kinase
MSTIIDQHQDDNFFSSLSVLTHAAATPISNILINLELIERERGHSHQDNLTTYLQRAVISAKYLKELMHQATINKPTHQQFKIKDALLELIEICKKPDKKGLLIPFLQLTGSEKLQGNKLFFQEAVLCLINNAFQAYQTYAPNKLVVLIAAETENTLELKVADGAQGFLMLSDSKSSKITLNGLPDATTGTGLAVVKEVVEQHFRGKVQISTQLNKGTTVHCSLPLQVTSSKSV